MTGTDTAHIPVLCKTVLDHLQVRPRGVYVDCTVGPGGHSREILKRLGAGRLVVLDLDEDALRLAARRLAPSKAKLSLHRENFRNLPRLLRRLRIRRIDGCLADVGVSSLQLDMAERGFSFLKEGPLDMRMDRAQTVTAASLVNDSPPERLVEILRTYGEVTGAARVVAALVEERHRKRFETTTELAAVVERVKGWPRGTRLHPATQVFQALRIEVNQELKNLEAFLSGVVDFLRPGGRLVVLAFHSLEDRLVKRSFARESGKCICFSPRDLCGCPRRRRVRVLTRRPVRPSGQEIRANPRARSAKLRAVERLNASSEGCGAAGSRTGRGRKAGGFRLGDGAREANRG